MAGLAGGITIGVGANGIATPAQTPPQAIPLPSVTLESHQVALKALQQLQATPHSTPPSAVNFEEDKQQAEEEASACLMNFANHMAFGAPSQSPPASAPRLLTTPPSTPVLTRPPDDDIRLRQKKFLTLLGGHFFHHYAKVLAPSLASKCLQSFAKTALLAEASTLYIKSISTPNPAASNPPTPTAIPKGAKSAYSMFHAALEASSNFLSKTMREERQDFAELMMEFILPQLTSKNLTEDEEALARDIFANYVPDVLHATLQSFSAKLQSLNETSRYSMAQAMISCMKMKLQPSGNLYVDQLTALLGAIMALMPDSVECGLETLFKRLGDPAVNEKLIKGLQEPLLSCFFPKPGTLSPKLKHIIVHSLQEVYNLLNTLNTSKGNADSVKLGPAAKASNTSNALLQNLCMNHKLFSDSEEENNILEKALEKLFWMLFYPGTSKERTPIQQLYILFARTAGSVCVKQLFDPYTLNCLIKRLLKQKISIQNPFERPAAKKRPNLDPNFSKALDELIPKILSEIVKFKTDSVFLRQAGQLALDFGKYFNKLPNGDEIQSELIELSESDAILLPAILLTQFAYLMEPPPKAAKPSDDELRKRFFASLTRKRPALEAKRLLEADADRKAQLQEKVHKKIMENTEELKKLLKDLPLGTDMAIDLIQKVYQLLNDPTTANIMVTYIVAGATKGLEAAAKANEALQKNVEPATIKPAALKKLDS